MNYELGFCLGSGYIVLSNEREPSDQTVLMDGGDAIQRLNGLELSREPSDQTDLRSTIKHGFVGRLGYLLEHTRS